MHALDPSWDSRFNGRRLDALGWGPWFEERFAAHAAAGLLPGRVVQDHGSAYTVQLDAAEVRAAVAGRVKHRAATSAVLPVIGDWVAVSWAPPEGQAVIHAVLERRSALSRQQAGEVTNAQVMAANVDRIFIVAALSEEPNLRRIERYLTIAWESGATPVVILTKADLAETPDLAVRDVEAIAPGVPVLLVSSVTGDGLPLILEALAPALTGVLVGPSGVGKSTLINRLLDRAALETQAVRRDGRGRHTTTHRELLALPGGGLLIDTPGMRELQLWAEGEGLERTFDDVIRLAASCRFNDCHHEGEPGCAVRRALDTGELAPERLASYRKLLRELHALAVRTDVRLQQQERKKWRAIHKSAKTRTRPG